MRKFFVMMYALVCLLFANGCLHSNAAVTQPNQVQEEVKPQLHMDVSTYEATFTHVLISYFAVVEGMYPEYDGYKETWKTRQTVVTQKGSGFVIKDGYIYTAAHVTEPDGACTRSGKVTTYCTRPFKIVSETIMIFDYMDTPTIAEKHYVDLEKDIAILKYQPNDYLKPFPYKAERVGLFPGVSVMTVVRKRDENGQFTSESEPVFGTILSNRITGVPDHSLPWFNMWDFSVDIKIQPGDSGSPLFALNHKGEIVVIGILRAIMLEFGLFYKQAFAVDFIDTLRFLDIQGD